MKLNELTPAEGSTKDRMRVGRGIGSGKGKTAGSGHKGQKARSGVAIKGFEGGQMPLYRRLPKMGFRNPNVKRYAEITPGRLQAALDAKKLDAKSDITADVLVKSGIISNAYDGVRLIGGGELTTKVKLKVNGGTKSAIAAVEKAGGSVEVVAKREKVKKLEKKAQSKA
ncbi:MAG: 50S ribosomal protein L15 [Pseudomonadota bacterium]